MPNHTKNAPDDFIRYVRPGRIRSIKPEWPQSQSMQAIEPLARLFYIGTWSLSDDEGRLGGRPDALKAAIFPTDRSITEWDCAHYLTQLEREQCLIRYREGNKLFIQLVTFQKHQKIDKPKRSVIPPAPTQGFKQMELDIEAPLFVPHGFDESAYSAERGPRRAERSKFP